MKLQQGDVLLRDSEIPKGAKKVSRKPRGYVLAEGEATGHAHVIEDDIEMFEDKGVLYIKVDRPTILKHEEHKPISIEKGTYAIGKVREYDPFSEEARWVLD